MRVLVTRPEPGASATAEKLSDIGYEPVILPLTQIEPLTVPEVDATAFDMLAVTSANAIRHAKPTLLVSVRHLPVVAVGGATVAAVRQAGFHSVEDAGGNVAELVQHIKRIAARGSRLLYLAGRVRAADIAVLLAEAGIIVTLAETYDAVPIGPETAMRIMRNQRRIDAVLVYSAAAATALNALIVQDAMLARAQFLCISPRVASCLEGPSMRILAAESPDEAAMFGLLETLRG